jgi:molybdenum cofactor synthesis domain-containing protein
MQPARPTAAVVSIGNEVLRGDTVDTNMAFLFAELYSRGVQPALGLTLPDEPEVIVARLREIVPLFTYVLTGGGIGPTPDDITRQAVAEAVGLPLELNAEAEAEYAKRRGTALNAGQREMCRLPRGCELIWGDNTFAPAFRVGNLYVFPGVPQVLRSMWAAVAERFSGPALYCASFKARSGESNWAHVMQRYCEQYPLLEFGSYPKIEGGWYSVVTVRGGNEAEVQRVAAAFEADVEAAAG